MPGSCYGKTLNNKQFNKDTAVVLMVLLLEPFPGFLVKFAYSLVLRKGFSEKCFA